MLGHYKHLIKSNPRALPTIPMPLAREASKAIVVNGMYGIGDNIHQRAVIRELMKKHEVWLRTCHVALYHDLVAQGLHLLFQSTRLHAQARTIKVEAERYPDAYNNAAPIVASSCKIWYNKVDIDTFGSIMNSMFGVLGLPIPQKPDFSLPIPDAWRERVPRYDQRGKPLMLYRPIVLRKEWNGASRNPDVNAYARLYKEIRDRFMQERVAPVAAQSGQSGPMPIEDLPVHNSLLSSVAHSA